MLFSREMGISAVWLSCRGEGEGRGFTPDCFDDSGKHPRSLLVQLVALAPVLVLYIWGNEAKVIKR